MCNLQLLTLVLKRVATCQKQKDEQNALDLWQDKTTKQQFTNSFVKTFPFVANINSILYVLKDDNTAPHMSCRIKVYILPLCTNEYCQI